MSTTANARNTTGAGKVRIRKALLRVRVHLDALFAQPRLYLQGVMWRARGLKLRSRHRFSALMGHSPRAYDLWIAAREPDRLAAIVDSAGNAPTIAVVIDCRATAEGLAATLASIAALHGAKPEVAIFGTADAAVGTPVVLPDLPALSAWAGSHSTGPESEAWLLPVRAGDLLAPWALAAYCEQMVRKPAATLLYADDDLIGADGKRSQPHFKPGWDPELYRHFDYLTGSALFACDPATIGEDWPRGSFDLSRPPVHVPHVLHHRRTRPLPVQPPAPSVTPDLPHVSVIVPTRDHADLLRTCMAGLDATRYPSFDVTIVDNDSRDPDALAYLQELRAKGVRIEPYPGAFNYADMHNAVVPSLAGPLVCLLNNDIEIIDADWLTIMATTAMRDNVGAVGARLLYPDRTIQHAGIVIGVGGGAGHAHRMQRDDEPGYFSRAHLPQHISAVTAACMLVRKDRFEAVGGFDAENFTVAFNDVDLCLKLNARGWQSFYEARACLVHHESKSRGLDNDPVKKARFAGELAALKRIWATDRSHDPYHHPELSQFGEQFVVRL